MLTDDKGTLVSSVSFPCALFCLALAANSHVLFVLLYQNFSFLLTALGSLEQQDLGLMDTE